MSNVFTEFFLLSPTETVEVPIELALEILILLIRLIYLHDIVDSDEFLCTG